MANHKHVRLLKRSVADWNQWRTDNAGLQPDLSGADLSGENFSEADLRKADLTEADLRGAFLWKTNFLEASLARANLAGTQLYGANFRSANLTEVNLSRADLQRATFDDATLVKADLSFTILEEAALLRTNLSEADLTYANLRHSILVKTICNKAIFTGCRVYGISAWDVQLEEAQQDNLIITPMDEPEITVDNLEVAQFIYLLLNNPRIRQVIDIITSKMVLVLGNFASERKALLDAIREQLRTKNYLPVVFDFDKPITRDFTETVMTLASMAKFVIADLTDPKCIPHELMSFAPSFPSVPVLPLLHASQEQEYAMFQDLQRRCHWVMETVRYQDQETLLHSLESTIILPAEQKAKELMATQRKEPPIIRG